MMPTSQSLSPSLAAAQAPLVRYYPVCRGDSALPLKSLGLEEAFIVPDFDLAEELIARGIDSSRVAISGEAQDPGYSQAVGGKQLVPASPFEFDQSILIVLPTYNERSNLEALVTA